MICKKKIFVDEDDYVNIIDYKSGKYDSEGFYHNKCYIDRIKSPMTKEMNAMKKMAYGLMGRANKMMDDAGIEKEEIYEIK